MANEELKGLPSEMRAITGGALKSASGTPLETLYKKVRKLNGQLNKGTINQQQYTQKTAEVANDLVYADGLNQTSLLYNLRTRSAELTNLFQRRPDLKFCSYDANDVKDLDLTALIGLTIDARFKANQAASAQATEEARLQNSRAIERAKEAVDLNFEPLYRKEIQLSPKNREDRKFYEKYFARIRQDGGSRDVLKWEGKPYDIPSWGKGSGLTRSDALNSLPDELKDSIDQDLQKYINDLKEHIKNCSPENERYLNPEPLDLDGVSDQDRPQVIRDFISQYQLERYFIDAYMNNVVPSFILGLIKSINRVGQAYLVKDPETKQMKKCYKWTHYEVELEDNYSQRPRPDFFVNYFIEHYHDSFSEWDKSKPVEPKLMSNSKLELADYYFQLPVVERDFNGNNDKLLQHCMSMLPEVTRDFYSRKFYLDTPEGREMFGRLLFFTASVLDASNNSAQSLCLANSGGTGKTFILCDVLMSWMNQQIGKGFGSKPANSNIFTEKFQNRTGVFDSVLTVLDEYDGKSAYDDSSWYKVVTGSNGDDAELSVQSLRENNQLKNTAHMKFIFCTNTDCITLPSRGARRRSLPLEMRQKEADGWCQEELIKKLKSEMPETVKAAFTYYYNTKLRDPSGYYFITTVEDYLEFLETGKLRAKTTEEMADYAFRYDDRFSNVYHITGLGTITNSAFYQELIEFGFEYDSEAVLTSREFRQALLRAYKKSSEAKAQKLLEVSEDGTDILATKGSKFSSLKTWMKDQYREEALGHLVQFKKARVKGSKAIVEHVFGLRPKFQAEQKPLD